MPRSKIMCLFFNKLEQAHVRREELLLPSLPYNSWDKRETFFTFYVNY
jgi:hypothetical protein